MDIVAAIQRGERMQINTINPHSFYVADKDPIFKKALEGCQVLLPDGIGVVVASNLINKHKVVRIAGMDIFQCLLKFLDHSEPSSNKRIFFLGSTSDTLNLIRTNIERDFPSITAAFYSPPFRTEFSSRETEEMIAEINRFEPVVLFVGMTAPKQEKWSFQNFHQLNAISVCSIGAVFDFYAGKIERPGKAWQRLGLEWLRRFSKEPRRLWERNLISAPYFIYKVMWELFAERLSLRKSQKNFDDI